MRFYIVMGVVISLQISGIFFGSSDVQAAQSRVVEDNAEIAGIISAREVNRITLGDDRIKSAVGAPTGYTIEHDPDSGDLFLVPFGFPLPTEPVNLFITAESGVTYQLFLEPRDIPAEQILITNRTVNPETVSSASRREKLAGLTRAVLTGESLDGYISTSTSTPIRTSIDAQIVPIEFRVGKDFKAMAVVILGNQDAISIDTIAPDAASVWLAEDGSRAIIIKEFGYVKR